MKRNALQDEIIEQDARYERAERHHAKAQARRMADAMNRAPGNPVDWEG